MIDGLSLQLRLVVVYRPPYSAAHPVTSSTFFPEFSEYLESLVLSKVPICIYGDFNVHLDVSDDADTIAFADLLESLCLTQYVKSLTHVMGHILDLIITRSSDNIIKVHLLRIAFFPITAPFGAVLMLQKYWLLLNISVSGSSFPWI